MATKKELHSAAWKEWQRAYDEYLDDWAYEIRMYIRRQIRMRKYLRLQTWRNQREDIGLN